MTWRKAEKGLTVTWVVFSEWNGLIIFWKENVVFTFSFLCYNQNFKTKAWGPESLRDWPKNTSGEWQRRRQTPERRTRWRSCCNPSRPATASQEKRDCFSHLCKGSRETHLQKEKQIKSLESKVFMSERLLTPLAERRWPSYRASKASTSAPYPKRRLLCWGPQWPCNWVPSWEYSKSGVHGFSWEESRKLTESTQIILKETRADKVYETC